MHLFFYHDKLRKQSAEPLARAAQRQHLLKKTLFWDILLFLAVIAAAVLLYWYAPFLARIPVLAAFLPVNDSLWERLKLLYFPAVFVGLLRYLFTGNLQKGILTTFAEGLLRCLGIFLVASCTLTGLLGKALPLADAVVFLLCSLLLTIYIRSHANGQKKSSLLGALLLLLLTGCFVYFTYNPPEIGLFRA